MKMDRILSITMILLERERVSIGELAEICEVTPRTIQRDLDVINLAGIPIVSYPGVGGGISILKNYKLEKRLFSTADITTLLMSLGSIRSSISGDEVVNALAKVKGVIPEEKRKEIEAKANQLTIDLSSWVGNPSHQEKLNSIQLAIHDNLFLHFAYSDRLQQKSKRIIEPYRVILKERYWYVEGYCLDRQSFRVFKLSRMTEINISEKHFEPREFHPESSLQPHFKDTNTVEVTLRVNERVREQLVDLFGEEQITQESENSWIAKISISNDVIGYRYLIGFGLDCECLAPPEVRHNLIDYLSQMQAYYQ
ncbi:helix-turn-helix transcriptional regulator [Candidatus Enterococcus murrayae]|uniref:YafY family transcriptional regulator n=1 Tax=Candidatus Enterococcus murrayae TaxID=2815321 RepID=A0ABS3HMC4_9ENTE|nr:YafY family protein [Enterococcus sp. MJM16]MBO0454600.1 YafY family transcriptional regulator [Enterococcus sp. MJM16]